MKKDQSLSDVVWLRVEFLSIFDVILGTLLKGPSSHYWVHLIIDE